MKKKIVVLIVFAIILTALFFVAHKPKNPNELTLFGNIEIRQVDLSFQVEGKIAKMIYEEGDSVKKGDLVAILDDRDYRADYQKSIASVNLASALSKNAQQVYNRETPLCSDDTLSKQEGDLVLSRKNETKAGYEASVAQRNFAKNQLAYTRIYAPDNGIITSRVQEPGATVEKGQPIYTLAKSQPVWIRAYVSERDLGNIKYNMKAKVYTDSVNPRTGKKREYVGRIGYISPVSEFTPKTVETTDLRTDLVYRIRVYVDKVDPYLLQGMPTTVKIDLKQS